MKTETLQEKWFTYRRLYCKTGHIDLLNCDKAHDPNLDTKPAYNLNSSDTYFRLNGEGEWISKYDLRGIHEDISNYGDLFTSDEYWDMAQVNCIRRAIGKDENFCKELYRSHGDFRTAIEHYQSTAGRTLTSLSGNSINNNYEK